MEKSNWPEQGSRARDEVYSVRIKAGRRTYFIDVKESRERDFYITITESKIAFPGEKVKYKIFLYKEDFNKFLNGLNEVVNHVKTELMPNFDFDRFNRENEYTDRQPSETAEGFGSVETPPEF